MHRTLPRLPDKNSPHKGVIRKPNQCKNPQLIHNVIHTPSPDSTKKLSSQEKHTEIFPNLHSSLISIGKLCDDECIVNFYKHKVIVIKNKDIVIEGYRDPTNGLWWFPLHHPAQNNKQVNIMEPHLCNHSRPMAPRHPRAYHPTSQKNLAIFYRQILCCPTKRTLLQAIKDGSFSTWPGLTEKLISKYLPESEITAKGHLNQQKKLTETEAAENVAPLSTKPG